MVQQHHNGSPPGTPLEGATRVPTPEEAAEHQHKANLSQSSSSSSPSDPPPPLAGQKGKVTKDGKHWLQNEEHVIPKNNLPLVFTGLMLSVALSALDQTIVSTALPTISADLHASASSYSWIASAYLLAATAVIPLYGRVSDLIGRKPLLLVAIFLFLLGSGLCAAAQNATWLCICRALQGLGGGGVIGMVQTITSDLVPLHRRAAFQGLFGAVWGISSVVGPLIGGALVNTHGALEGWRWLFLINLPIGIIPALIILFFLHLNPPKKRAVMDTVREFDFVGYLGILAAVIIFLFGFSQAEINGFNTPASIALIVVGGCLFPVPILWGFYVERAFPHVLPIFPSRLFRTRTTILLMVTIVLHGFNFFAATYELPVYFQATRGATPLLSGVYMLPYALVGSIASAVCGPTIVRLKAWRPVFWWGWTISVLGYGLMSQIDYNASWAYVLATSGVCGLGYGVLFQTPLIGMLSAMPHKDQAAVTSTSALLRSLSGSVGITVCAAIFNSRAASLTRNIPGYTTPANPSSDLRGLQDLQPPSLAHHVQYEYGEALQTVFIILAPIAGVGFLLSLGVKGYSMQRRNVNAPDANAKKEAEAGSQEGQQDRSGESSGDSGDTANDPITTDIEKHAGGGIATTAAAAAAPGLANPAFEDTQAREEEGQITKESDSPKEPTR